MTKVNPDKAAMAAGFLWRYLTARHLCLGEAPASQPAAGLARDIEDGIQVFDAEIRVNGTVWPPVTDDAKHDEFFRAIVQFDDAAMPELLHLARWQKYVHNNAPIPARPEPKPDFSFRALYWGNDAHQTNADRQRHPLVALCIGLLVSATLSVSAHAHPRLGSFAPIRNIVEAQWPGWSGGPGYAPEWAERRERCDRLRHAYHEIGERMHYAPPWERGRMEARLYEVRERIQHECWRGW